MSQQIRLPDGERARVPHDVRRAVDALVVRQVLTPDQPDEVMVSLAAPSPGRT
jgi:hypothetical protein